ncbi:protein tiptop [Episyrphus balteatus]|uniref:protein tiptop n=1 Tax=Episyrphus balteatus TaxID=286459 RepID=UPI0024853D6D|nr:protein tiptop [Episyrphus balteatus]XP_055856262.1 protein tiptop [Episyrphus balteatus]
MRSKQQPKPSFRWTNSNENDQETLDEAGQQDTNANASQSSTTPLPSPQSPPTETIASSSSSSLLVLVENDKRIILPPSDRSSSPNEAIAAGTITPSASASSDDALNSEKNISISIKGSPISPQGLTRLRPFSSASLSTSPSSMPDDGLLRAEKLDSSSQPPVTGTEQLHLLSQEPLGDASSIIYPKQLKSSDLEASTRTTMTTTTTTTAMPTMAVAAASTMTMNCSRNDNDTENGINVNITSAYSPINSNSICGGDAASENDDGCISTTTTRTTPINFSSRMPSELIDSHDGDGGDDDDEDDDDDVPPTTPADDDDVTFNRRGVDLTLPHANGNQNNFNTKQHTRMSNSRRKGELASPRCQSRDSTGSTGGGRCQSDDSNCSGNGSNTAPTPSPHSPPVGLPLPATLPQSAAAALLPPSQSAAMAAYLNAAAAAAQQNRLLMNNPLAGLQSAGQSPSPRLPTPDDSPALDFSTKRSRRDSEDSDAMNLSNKSDGIPESPPPITTDVNCPLDLSVSSRKRSTDDEEPLIPRKMPRPNNDYKNIPTAWVPPINPYLAAVAAAGMSPKGVLPMDWNGKNKMVTNDATKALEKMSEMTRLGGSEVGDMRSPAQPIGNSGASTGRHSAWQSHWLNKGADAVKDVFKCVWCKLSFPTLATLTTHMKETQHCGVNVPPSQQNHHDQHHRHPPVSSGASSNVTTSSSSSSSKSDLNLLIKETMPLPRKLVRGQDVWLGKGAEQTRQILKCMWCGQSFRSLAEMTNHMQQTQHYTNIISQEQIISWKSSDEKGGGGGGGSTPNAGPPPVGPPPPMAGPPQSPQSGGPPSPANSTVSAVLTCKVCDQAFSSLKDLSNHMIKNAHYKEHIMRSITETGGRRRQTREKRKKSLPVRKLLELERAAGQQDFKTNDHYKGVSTKITCEKCGDKIETALFVDHIRQCVGGAIANASPRSLKNTIIPPDSCLTSPPTPGSRDGLKSISPASTSSTHRHISPHLPSPTPKDQGEKTSSSPSVLNAIEQLIEKSFDTRSSRHGAASYNQNNSGTPLGASILKRLGIDETVDYTKPLIDAQTMGLLRSYHQHHQSQYGGRRERSGSESSSISERGSSRMESLTPERKPPLPPSPPRRTPDKISRSPNLDMEHKEFKVKTEPNDEEEQEEEPERHSKISVRKEFNIEPPPPETGGGELDLRKHRTPSSSAAPSPVPTSPSSSDRSSAGCGEKKLPGSSLTALSSMFDSLNSHSATSSANDIPSAGGKKSSSANPLAALQKLCEKTENPPATSTRLNSSNNNHHSNGGNLTGAGTPSGMVAFSWACNDAVITSDSVIKCAFCDTPFCSKGAYRHHLSKVHFVKDDASMEPLLQSTKPMMSGSSSSSSSSAASSAAPPSPKARSPASAPQLSHPPPPPPPTAQSPAASAADESVQSKFLKYTELAKQLSSKYV